MKNLLIQLNQRPIAVYPIYIKITGSVNAGLLLSQIMYWYGAVNGRIFYKSDLEIMEETCLSESELRTAKNKLKSLSFIEIKAKGVPARTHYYINSEKLISEINNFSSVKSTKLKTRNQQNYNSEINETITENTTENTTKITTDIECENSFTPPQPKIKNSFSRQSIHDSISHEQGFKEKEKGCEQKEKESRSEPSETYSAFISYCQAYENCAKVTLPKNKQGNYIMTAKDGSNCKKLVSWIRQVAVVEGTMDDMVAAFTKAAWHVSDKFMKNNFSISMIYSQANAIYTKFHYQNPAAQEKRRQEEIDRLVNEFEG
jgi:hypothetical protein